MADAGLDDRLENIMNGFAENGPSGTMFADATAIIHLARLDRVEYSRRRKEEARGLGIKVGDLDREVEAHRRATRLETVATGARQWLKGCQFNQQGEPRSNLANTLTALRSDPRVAQIARYDEMLRLPILMQPIPGAQIDGEFERRSMRDEDHTLIQEFLQREGLEAVSADTVRQAVNARARELSFHPVRQYLDGLEWDGRPRISDWLTTYLGADSTEYTRNIGSMFLTSMVARVMNPGCKADHMLTIEGAQGAFKSTTCAILGGPWYSDSLPDIRSGKDVSQHLNGKWLIEVAELSALDKAEAAALKAFITRTSERYRPSYGHAEVVEPRQCVFIGTTNKSLYLRDETGGRRFWPVRVGTIKTDELTRDRDQLFAEAACRYAEGAVWWPDAAFEAQHIVKEQAARFEVDAWEETIETWLDKLHDDPGSIFWQSESLKTPRCTVSMVARLALHMEDQKIGTFEQRRIRNALERLGWFQPPRTTEGRFYKPGEGAIDRAKERLQANQTSMTHDAL